MSPSRVTVAALPRGGTAQRLTWEFLPPDVRSSIEHHLGSQVAEARSCDGGFTPGFASVLTGADGSQLFVKAASRKAQAPFAAAYAEEARKLRLLGDTIPAPRLRFVEDDDWLVVGFEAVTGDTPHRPWRPAELSRALSLAEEVAEATRDVPDELGLVGVTADLPRLVTGWSHVAATRPDWPHLDEATALASAFADLPADRFAHTDLRDDNLLLLDDGRALACDWNWPTLAPPWIDLVVMLVAAYGDGLDVDPLLSERALTRDVPPDAVDAWLAAFCGFMLESADLPVPASSPYLRAHGAWYAEAAWAWLADRRGW